MGSMPPRMGQPITVIEKQSSNPAMLRFETNRPLSGMGHERYSEPPSDLLQRPVDELARRLFAAGGVEAVHINGSVVTVRLGGGRTGAGLGDIVRGLFLHYGPQAEVTGVTPPTDPADVAPEATADPGQAPAALTAVEPATGGSTPEPEA
jgi:Scaffold protein Nfu/NifU N terminal